MLPTISIKYPFRYSFVPSTHRILREGSSSKSKMCVSLQRRAIPHFKIHVLLQRRAPKCMNLAHDVRGNTRHTKITILPQFRPSDQHEVTKGFTDEVTNSHFTSVLDVRWARNDERVARRRSPIRISPQFWTSDEHETTSGFPTAI